MEKFGIFTRCCLFQKVLLFPLPKPPPPPHDRNLCEGTWQLSLSGSCSSAVYFVTPLFLRLIHPTSINAKLVPEHFPQHSSVCT